MTAEEIRDIPKTHNAYVDVVARVSKKHNTIFVDMPRYLNRLSPSMKTFFRNDLIHLKDPGHEAIADEIYNQMKSYNSSNNLTWDSLLR